MRVLMALHCERGIFLFRRGLLSSVSTFFFFNDTATTEIYTLSLHDALPIYHCGRQHLSVHPSAGGFDHHRLLADHSHLYPDRKSTRLNSSHLVISYAVFCLKKKKYICGSFTSLNTMASSAAFPPLDLLICEI